MNFKPLRKIRFLAALLLLGLAFGARAQNCDVDFPGTANVMFSAACGASPNNVTLGNSTNFGGGDVLTFDADVTISGNVTVNADGSGKIIVPAGVSVIVDGNFRLNSVSGGCSGASPCVFEIVVNGTLQISNNFRNDLNTLIWSGTGTIIFDKKLDNSNSGCMQCGTGGCPTIEADDCADAGSGCSSGDFCATVNACTNDTTVPTISGCPSNINVSITGAGCTQPVNWTIPTALDNCTIASFTSSHSPGFAFPKGATVVTYTAKDPAGNTATCSFTVTINDITLPLISGCPANITVNTNSSCNAVVNWTAPTFTDNCTGGTLVSTKPPGSTFSVGPTTVTYTATDAAGNTATCSFIVTVNDITPPVISGCPANITVNANASCNAVVNWTAPTFTDNCTGGTLVSTNPPGSTFPVGPPTTVTYTATDAAGNTATCSFIVTVNDITPPVISGCPANIAVNTNTSCSAVVNWTAPAFSDNCTGGTIVSTNPPGSTFPVGPPTTVTYTATDASGNTVTCSFTVTVNDITPPVISGCPANIAVNTNTSCSAVVNWTAPAFSDNCTGGTIVSTKSPGSTFPVGPPTTVTYTATDAAGNTSTCSFTVTVVDMTAPVFSNCPIEVKATARPQSCDAVVNWTLPTAMDNCGGSVTVSSSHNPGDTFPIGSTIVNYTATDVAGNTSPCEFTVMVSNESAPVIAGCPQDISVRAEESGAASVTWVEPTVSVACGEVTLESTHHPADIFPVGVTEVVYTAVVAHGENASCKFTVTVDADIQFEITQVVSPNGDGVNDQWELSDIENYARNEVVVVDRWGNVIYKASGYNNGDVAWRGENMQGAIVPNGTYFYTIFVDFSSSRVEKRGFVEVVR